MLHDISDRPESPSSPEGIQWTFNKLIEQGGPSVDSGGTCKYRGHDGKRCAAGWWIDDNNLAEKMDTSEDCSLECWVTEVGLTDNKRLAAVETMQAAHDAAAYVYDTSSWKEMLNHHWKKRGLNV